MNTPDTEWKKEFDEIYGDYLSGYFCCDGRECGCNGTDVKTEIVLYIQNLLTLEWNEGFEKGRSEYLDKARDIDEAISSHTTYWKERMQEVRNENLECVADNAEDYIHKEKGGNPLPTVEESAVRGFVQYLRENTTTPINKDNLK